jgi:hypothetical protein
MSDLLVLAAIFAVPTLTGAALGVWRWGFVVALGLAALALATGLFFLFQIPPPGSDRLGHAVFTNLMFLVAAELAAGWALVALGRFLVRKRRT